MKKLISVFVFLFSFFLVFPQQEKSNTVVDSLYREDQFYVGFTYNLLGKMPDGVSQNGFSSGFHLGFVRDMPINKSRTLAFGLGLGYSVNSFNQNILISKGQDGNYAYTIIDNSEFSKNKFHQHLLEIPLEFRYRKSTSTEYKFFRLHTGFKLGYVFANSSKYKGSLNNQKYNGIADFNDFQYAFTVSIGYNTWNMYFLYTLNPIFDSNAKINGDSIDMNAIKLGLVFYIL